MKIKRFADIDSRRAMSKVRAELGADAVILSNKKVNGQVELVAAVDIDESALNNKLASQSPITPPEPENPALAELHNELSKLRGLLEGELSQLSWRDMARQPAPRSTLYNRLGKLGLSRSLSGSLIDKLPPGGSLGQQWKRAMELLAAQIAVRDDVLKEGNNIIALVGSTGVGKTTTIAKLAARYVLRYGGRQVAVVSTDRYRIGGKEQLETLAKYLGVPVKVATDGAQLNTVLDKLSSRKLVLIDTAGMSQRDTRLYEQFATLRSVGHDVAIHAVLGATTQPAMLNEVIKVFGKDKLTSAIITKLDEAASIGGVLDVIIRNRLSLSYLGTGQRVPEDIIPARADYLVDKAVELSSIHNPVVPEMRAGAQAMQSIAV